MNVLPQHAICAQLMPRATLMKPPFANAVDHEFLRGEVGRALRLRVGWPC